MTRTMTWNPFQFPVVSDTRSQKLCLFRIHSSSLIGRVVSQEDVMQDDCNVSAGCSDIMLEF